ASSLRYSCKNTPEQNSAIK
ncbi:uncharacterized protein Dvir_GJ26840, partial [Drosophila virilis]